MDAGLGWMVEQSVWSELGVKWPSAFWDDWMREPKQRRDRACLRPELSRTAMSPHGKKGVSKYGLPLHYLQPLYNRASRSRLSSDRIFTQ